MLFYSPRLFFRDLWISVPLIGVVLIQLFIWWTLVAGIRQDTGIIFLHYNIIFGVDLTGDWWQIYYLPLFGILVIFFNYLCSSLLYFADKFLARLLTFWTLFFHIFLMIGIVLLVRLNS